MGSQGSLTSAGSRVIFSKISRVPVADRGLGSSLNTPFTVTPLNKYVLKIDREYYSTVQGAWMYNRKYRGLPFTVYIYIIDREY